MEELALSQADVVRLSGLSDPTVRGFMTGRLRGEPKRPNIHKLCKALGWQPSSIDDVLAGGAPTLLPSESPTQLDDVLRRVERLERSVAHLLIELAQLKGGAEPAPPTPAAPDAPPARR